MDEESVKILRKEWVKSTMEPDPHPEITTLEERQAEEELREKIAKDVAAFNDQILMMALTGRIAEQEAAVMAEETEGSLVIPEPAAENLPVGAQNIIELPEPVVHALPAPRMKRRCDGQPPKAKYKTNAQKRKEREQRKKARAR